MCRRSFPLVRILLLTAVLAGCLSSLMPGGFALGVPVHAANAQGTTTTDAANLSAATAAAEQYVIAMVRDHRVEVSRLDFACQFLMTSASEKGLNAFPKASDSIYDQCWATIERANAEPVDQHDRGMHTLWPGKDTLVFYPQDLGRYAASSFVSKRLGRSSHGGGVTIKHEGTTPIPGASFRLRPSAGMVGAPAALVRMRVLYKDPLMSPASYAAGTYQWANPVKRPRAALKAVTLQWVVLSNLKQLGFPGDHAVVNLPVVPATATQPAVPFLTERSRYVSDSAEWWKATDQPKLLVAAVSRAAQLPKLNDRVAMLNRILIIDPAQPDALTALSRDLYQAILNNGTAAHHVKIQDKALAERFNEFYWDTYAQTDRMDISLGMEMGGYAQPTTADYLFRMIPEMEKLAEIRPDDLENRFRLGVAYRWNLDQLTAIETHEALVRALPKDRAALRARALTELAWSRITKAAYNRTFDDPGVRLAYEEAEEALNLSENAIDKFAAAYTMAYSLIFTPDRDNHAILELLTEARRWYLKIPGASEHSWQVLLRNETLRPVIKADPKLQPLLAAGDRG